MTKKELIELLESHKENQAKLKLRKKEKKMYEKQLIINIETENSTTTKYGINQDIHSKNKISDKVGKTVEESIDKTNKMRKEAEEKIKELEIIIQELEDIVEEGNIRLSALKYREYEILTAYYIEGRTYEDIGNNLYFRLFNQTRDKDTIKDIVKKATKIMLNL